MFGLETKLLVALGLAAAALGWLGWHDHKIRQQCAIETKLAADKEYREHAEELDRIANTATARRESLAADAARARAAADRLRVAVGPGIKFSAPAASSGPAATDSGDLLSLVLGRLVDMAAVADERGSAGDACVSAYNALRK